MKIKHYFFYFGWKNKVSKKSVPFVVIAQFHQFDAIVEHRVDMLPTLVVVLASF